MGMASMDGGGEEMYAMAYAMVAQRRVGHGASFAVA